MTETERDKTLHSSGVDHLPLPRGRFKVGYVDVLNGVARDRGCLFRIFYPSEAEEHICPDVSRRATWLPQPEGKYADGYAWVQGHVAYYAHKMCCLKATSIHIPATLNAKPARENWNAFPVIIFSHDIGECRTTNSSLCVELASHGCVVAAIEHRDNTACRTYYVENIEYKDPDDETDGADLKTREETREPLQSEEEVTMCESAIDEDDDNDDNDEDEEDSTLLDTSGDEADAAPKFKLKTHSTHRTVWVNYRPVPKTRETYNIRTRQLNRRVAECIRTLNCLEAINKRGVCKNELPGHFSSELAGIMNMARVTVIGRGFGGSTAYMALQIEDRTVCGVAIDPLMYIIARDRPNQMSRPLMMLLNGRHIAREDVKLIRRMFRKSDPAIYTLLGSEADAQSDLPFIYVPSFWKSLSLSWPMVAPSTFTSLDLGSCMILKFISDKCNFQNHDRDFYDDYVKRRSNLVRPGVTQPPRFWSKYSNNR